MKVKRLAEGYVLIGSNLGSSIVGTVLLVSWLFGLVATVSFLATDEFVSGVDIRLLIPGAGDKVTMVVN